MGKLIDLTGNTPNEIVFIDGNATIKGSIKIQYEIGKAYYSYGTYQSTTTTKEYLTLSLDSILNLANMQTIQANHYDDLHSIKIDVNSPLFYSVELIFE